MRDRIRRRCASIACATLCGLSPGDVAAGGAPGAGDDSQNKAPARVLFVGNSYTYVNDLPRMFAALAAMHGVAIEVQMQARPNFSLADHLGVLRFGSVLMQPWDVIVLQQGPSALPASRRNLRRSVERIARRLHGRAVTVALLAAWPQRPHSAMSHDAELSYRLAAETIDACVLPVATAWRRAREHDATLALYQSDGLHPTAAGSLLAAMTILQGLVDVGTAPLLPPAPDTPADDRALWAALETAARRARSEESRACAPALQAR
jgi:hypothetical protein